jgi:hypothetical protein
LYNRFCCNEETFFKTTVSIYIVVLAKKCCLQGNTFIKNTYTEVPWIPEPSVNNKLKRREGSGSTGGFFD